MWTSTPEFYIIAGVIAAAIIAYAALPSRRGAAVLHTVAGELSNSGSAEVPAGIDVSIDDAGHMVICRRGLPDVGDDGAASLAVTIIGFDISIEERLTPGKYPIERRDTAIFTLDFLAPERYHVRYNSDTANLFTAFSIPIRPGITLSRQLH